NRFDASAIGRDFKNGVAGQGFVEIRAPGTPLGFRAAVSYNRFNVTQVQYTVARPGTPTTSTTPDGYSQIIAGLANVTLQLPTGPIRPYVIAGLGAFNLKNAANVGYTPGGTVSVAPE